MKTYAKTLFAFFLVCFCLPWSVLGQEYDFYELTPEQVFSNPEIKPADALVLAEKKYAEALEKGDLQAQLGWSKCMADASFFLERYPQLSGIESRIDSLAKLLPEAGYDHQYSLFKVSLAQMQRRFDDAVQELGKVREEVMASKNNRWICEWYAKMAVCQMASGDRAAALEYILESDAFYPSDDSPVEQALLLNARAAYSSSNGEFDKTLDYATQAADRYEHAESWRSLLSVYPNIVFTAQRLGKEAIAADYNARLLSISEKMGVYFAYYRGQLNTIFDYIDAGAFDDALAQADRVIGMAASMGQDPMHAIYLKGVAYRGFKDFGTGAAYIQKAYKRAEEANKAGERSFYAHALYETFSWDEQFQKALDWYITYTQIEDSVSNQKAKNQIAVYESQLETLDEKRKVKELETKARINSLEKQVLWTGIVFGLLLAGALFYAQKLRHKKRRAEAKVQLEKTKKEKEKLEQQLEFRQKELASHVLSMTRKNVVLQDVREGLQSLSSGDDQPVVHRLKKTIDRNIESSEDWEKFLSVFKKIHSSFLEKLNSLNEELTSHEIRLASLLKMNMSSKEIALLLNISNDGIKKARYRLRKKLNLDTETNLQEFILRM